MTERRAAVRAGAWTILPLVAAVFPFGLVYGVAVVESPMIDWVGGLASALALAGAAQLTLIELLTEGAPWTVALGTALAMNLRFVMYSGALAPSFAEYPRRWRVPLAYLMTDQVAVTSLLYNRRVSDPVRRMGHYLGSGIPFALSWVAGTWIGILVGGSIPGALQLSFAIPLMFLALLIPSIRDRAGLVAALVGGGVTVLARGAPVNTGLLIGAACGIAAGMAVER